MKQSKTKRQIKGEQDRENGKPRRALNVYNLFFKKERKKIMQELEKQVATAENANVGFKNLARMISDRWKLIDDATMLELEAEVQLDKERYKREMIEWKILIERRKTKEEDEESHNADRNCAEAVNIDIIFDENKQPGDGIGTYLVTPEITTSNKDDEYQSESTPALPLTFCMPCMPSNEDNLRNVTQSTPMPARTYDKMAFAYANSPFYQMHPMVVTEDQLRNEMPSFRPSAGHDGRDSLTATDLPDSYCAGNFESPPYGASSYTEMERSQLRSEFDERERDEILRGLYDKNRSYFVNNT